MKHTGQLMRLFFQFHLMIILVRAFEISPFIWSITLICSCCLNQLKNWCFIFFALCAICSLLAMLFWNTVPSSEFWVRRNPWFLKDEKKLSFSLGVRGRRIEANKLDPLMWSNYLGFWFLLSFVEKHCWPWKLYLGNGEGSEFFFRTDLGDILCHIEWLERWWEKVVN